MKDIHPLYFLWQNKLPILGALMVALTAAINTAPIPTSTLGVWAYDWAHQVFNIKNTRLVKESIPTPPDDKEKQL